MPNLLLIPILFLATAVLLVPLAKRLGLGSVLGYLAGGCLIGPWGLGLFRGVETLMDIAEIGVVLMLFLIGLELDPRRLWGMRRRVFGGGALQMGICSLGLAAWAWWAGLPLLAAVVAGLALAMSSTAITLQTLTENHLEATPMGRTAFSILLFQDIAAIPLIAIVPLLGARSPGHAFEPQKILLALAAIAAVILIGRYLTRPLLRLVASTGLREIFTAFSLLLVLGIAQLMTVAGLSMGLGAFLAGILLAGSEYRRALEADLEPFKGLLLGLFFTSVGMSMDFGILQQAPLQIIGLVASFVLLKMLLLALITRPLGVAAVQRGLFAGLLAQGGEFAFVLFGVAHDAHVLPGNWEAQLTLVVAISMALTPLLAKGGQVLSARLHRTEPQPADRIDVAPTPVIIAGFGRVGQIVSRLLYVSGIRATVLDNDPEEIEVMRRFGFRVFYGDATRLDLLQAAEAGKAAVLVNAIDDVDSSLALTELVQTHFPHLQMVARARNVSHLFELRERGVTHIERETFEAALRMGRMVLEQLGVEPYTAREAADKFRRHNRASLEAIFPHYRDEAAVLPLFKAARQELAESFEYDRQQIEKEGRGGWAE